MRELKNRARLLQIENVVFVRVLRRTQETPVRPSAASLAGAARPTGESPLRRPTSEDHS
jgi:hypothetical protein